MNKPRCPKNYSIGYHFNDEEIVKRYPTTFHSLNGDRVMFKKIENAKKELIKYAEDMAKGAVSKRWLNRKHIGYYIVTLQNGRQMTFVWYANY